MFEFDAEGRGYSATVRMAEWESMDPESAEKPDFVAYGSKIDRTSNDPSYIEGQSLDQSWGLRRNRVIPAVAGIHRGAKLE